MRIVPCILVLAFLLAGSTGCQLFNKKNSDEGGPFLPAKNKNEKPKADPVASSDPLIGGGNSGVEVDGILAGRVMDGAGRPADAQIRWVCLDDPKEESPPIDVAVDQQGYFMIQGLKNGKRYKLITRAKSGDKTLEVETFAQAPNPRLNIFVSDKFAVPVAPEKAKTDKGKKSASGVKEQQASAQIPVPGPNWQQNPATMMPPPLPPYVDKTKIAEQADYAVKPPMAEIKGGFGGGAPGGSPYSIAPGPTPVPSSVRIGSRLENFALYDVSLQTWELKKDRRGKLVLLDFWKTNCPPCLQTIPTLRILQNQYGAKGLQVVAVTYEDTGSLAEQAHRITAVAQQRQTNYQILIGGGAQCPLKRDLQIRNVPTLVLVDETGAILWAHEGLMDRGSVEDLEFTIKRRLG
ncbi:MAG TPA: TlpA disulfide reductase family protein [Gemmataceae bacterium]|nr:TlpA disulfide reductase family protein [Gemmataceae bacterium]